MFAVIILFQVKPEKENSFRMAWKSLTELIYEHEGSLGSRLHKANDLTYIAYAQWPDRATWVHANHLPEHALAVREELRACCERIEIKYELEMVEDVLKTEVFKSL